MKCSHLQGQEVIHFLKSQMEYVGLDFNDFVFRQGEEYFLQEVS